MTNFILFKKKKIFAHISAYMQISSKNKKNQTKELNNMLHILIYMHACVVLIIQMHMHFLF